MNVDSLFSILTTVACITILTKKGSNNTFYKYLSIVESVKKNRIQ